MELHQLRYFVAVADLGNFTRAAEKCLVAQPSLSQQIIKLERELRQPLFERLGRSVRLTEAWRTLNAQAVTVLGTVDEIHDRVTAATDPLQGNVNVGAIPGPVLTKALPRILPLTGVLAPTHKHGASSRCYPSPNAASATTTTCTDLTTQNSVVPQFREAGFQPALFRKGRLEACPTKLANGRTTIPSIFD